MRPLRLEIQGLRSYRTKCEVNFSQVDLIAIVGDTGVGKSSLLEAINYALYNRPTWEAGPKQLISDGLNTMIVSLDFQAEGRIYQVTRSTSRGTYPLPVHKLTCLSDPTIQGRDGEHAVSEEICRLVGLDASAFKSAVILPQGRFQTLLEATSADRTRLLKGILRLEQIDQVRERAADFAHRVRPTLEDLQRERLRLFEDPETVAKLAEERGQAAKERRQRLRAAQGRYLEAEKKRQEAEGVIIELDRLDHLLKKSLANPPVGRLKRLLLVEKDIRAQETSLQTSLERFRADEAKCLEELRNASDIGQGVSEVSKSEAVLIRLLRDIPELEKEQRELEGQATELTKQESTLGEQVNQLALLREATTSAEAAVAGQRDSVAASDRAVAEGRDRLRVWREALSTKSTAADSVNFWRDQVDQGKTVLAEAELETVKAQQSLDVARSHLEEIHRQHSAVHAAQGLSAGEPCPICARELPDDFTAPIALDEREAKTSVQLLEGQLQQAQAEEVTRRERQKQATGNLAAAEAAQRSAEVQLKQARTSLAATLAVVDISKSDDELIASVVAQAAAAANRLALAEEAAKKARSLADTTAAQLNSRQQSLAESRRVLDAAITRLVDRKVKGEKDCADLPAPLRPPKIDEAQVAAALSLARARLGELRSLEQTLQQARLNIQENEAKAASLRQSREQDIHEPRRAIDADLATLRERISRAVELLDLPDAAPPEVGGERSLAEDLVLATVLEGSSARLVGRVQEKSDDAKSESANAADNAASILADLKMAEPAELEESLVAAATELQLADSELATAKSQQPRAAALDKVIGQGTSLIASLDELGRLLTDGRFIGVLATRKQTILLHLASDILGSITSRRYGFAEDFEIVDRGTGQPRSAKTLSGGEKFLASLALALALVELAGRSGGRLEALFLDEGFGSLDANSLDEALSELERRASNGRLVAVVSHIRSVAERIENVLLVTKTATGSAAHWAADNESDELIQETVEAGLLA